jgi:hypothetical protein
MEERVEPRPLNEVIEAIKRITPHTFSRAVDFIPTIKSIADSSLYAPPEGMYLHWDRLIEALDSYLGIVDEDWKKEVQGVVNGHIDYKKYLFTLPGVVLDKEGALGCLQ